LHDLAPGVRCAVSAYIIQPLLFKTINHRLGHRRSLHVKLYNYLHGIQKDNEFPSINSHSLQKLCHMSQNIIQSCRACLQADVCTFRLFMKQSLVARKKKCRHHSMKSAILRDTYKVHTVPEIYLLKCALYSVTNSTSPTLCISVLRISMNPITANNAHGKILLMTPQNRLYYGSIWQKTGTAQTFQPKPPSEFQQQFFNQY
jgi:hypothetical protein